MNALLQSFKIDSNYDLMINSLINSQHSKLDSRHSMGTSMAMGVDTRSYDIVYPYTRNKLAPAQYGLLEPLKYVLVGGGTVYCGGCGSSRVCGIASSPRGSVELCGVVLISADFKPCKVTLIVSNAKSLYGEKCLHFRETDKYAVRFFSAESP